MATKNLPEKHQKPIPNHEKTESDNEWLLIVDVFRVLGFSLVAFGVLLDLCWQALGVKNGPKSFTIIGECLFWLTFLTFVAAIGFSFGFQWFGHDFGWAWERF